VSAYACDRKNPGHKEAMFENIKFDANGLIPAVTVDADTHEVLMVAYMNREALDATLKTGRATYWSRSRQALLITGETSGHVQEVGVLRTDCDPD